MCGIVGYVGSQNAVGFLVDGLRKLEYRGYDSAGVATVNNAQFQIARAVGRIDHLANRIQEVKPSGQCGIGHTRWATHGPATVDNAHPHVGGHGEVVLVHNGVIEKLALVERRADRERLRVQVSDRYEVVSHLVAEGLRCHPQKPVKTRSNHITSPQLNGPSVNCAARMD